jgi:hypothetical protein
MEEVGVIPEVISEISEILKILEYILVWVYVLCINEFLMPFLESIMDMELQTMLPKDLYLGSDNIFNDLVLSNIEKGLALHKPNPIT